MELLTQQFISFLTAASGGTTLGVTLETYDLLANVTFTLNVSGLTGSETTFQLGKITSTQITTYLAQQGMLYPNVPPLPTSSTIAPFLAFSDQAYNAMFNCTWTEHVVNVSSQCNFSISIATGQHNIIYVDSHPVLLDITTARTNENVWDTPWDGPTGAGLTDAELAVCISSASSEMVNFLRNNIVLTTYLQDTVIDPPGGDSVNLNKVPIRNFFSPVIRRPSYYNVTQTGTLATIKSNYEPDTTRGRLTYRFYQPLVDAPQPFDSFNEVLIAYVAGYQKIPLVIKKYASALTTIAIDQYSEVGAEGSRFKNLPLNKVLEGWVNYLGDYFCI